MPLNEPEYNLSSRELELCLKADLDPAFIDQINDDSIYSVSDLMMMFKATYPTIRRVIEGVPRSDIGRPIKVKGSSLKESIFARIRNGKPPFN